MHTLKAKTKFNIYRIDSSHKHHDFTAWHVSCIDIFSPPFRMYVILQMDGIKVLK